MFSQLGNHKFDGLKSPTSLTEKQSVKFGRISLINSKDVLQFTGKELTELTLSILYSIDFCDPAAEIDALQKSMHSAEILPFIMGDSKVIGKFVITNIDVTNQRYNSIGALEVASVNINLLECGVLDEGKPIGAAVVKAGTLPPITSPQLASPIISPAQVVTSEISKGRNAINKMKTVGKSVKNGTTKLKNGVRKVRELANDVKQAYSTAKTKVENTKKIIQRASELPTSLDGAIKYAENLAKLDDVADVSVLNMNISEMSNHSNKVTVSATPVVAFSATKEGGS